MRERRGRMEEQNKNPEKKENEVQTSQENTPQNATPTRSYVLMILAGCYLLYTGYRLCKMSSMELTVAAGAFLRQESVS